MRSSRASLHRVAKRRSSSSSSQRRRRPIYARCPAGSRWIPTARTSALDQRASRPGPATVAAGTPNQVASTVATELRWSASSARVFPSRNQRAADHRCARRSKLVRPPFHRSARSQAFTRALCGSAVTTASGTQRRASQRPKSSHAPRWAVRIISGAGASLNSRRTASSRVLIQTHRSPRIVSTSDSERCISAARPMTLHSVTV